MSLEDVFCIFTSLIFPSAVFVADFFIDFVRGFLAAVRRPHFNYGCNSAYEKLEMIINKAVAEKLLRKLIIILQNFIIIVVAVSFLFMGLTVFGYL